MLETLFSPHVVTKDGVASLEDEAAYPEEAAYVQRAVARRRAEFWTARRCARDALAAFGFPAAPLLRGEGGAPLWPAGVVGSISHTHGYCSVAVARCPPLRSLGLDVETVRPIEAAILDVILLAPERAWLERQPSARRNDLATLFFGAKEAFYKCQYPVSGTFLDFREAEVALNLDASTFEVRALRGTLPKSVMRVRGRFAFAEGRVACGVALPFSDEEEDLYLEGGPPNR